MIKIKVYRVHSYSVYHDTASYFISDYAYNTYLFGFLISSVTIRGVEHKEAKKMFGNKIIDLD